LAPLRDALRTQGLADAVTVNRAPNGRRMRYAGLVINRQHPESASGVVFMTLEDETGWVNLVVWPQVFQDNFIVARTANPVGVTGKVQMQDGVTHLVVERFWVPEISGDASPLPSRDFR
jgi:error-prone DNA polymerase